MAEGNKICNAKKLNIQAKIGLADILQQKSAYLRPVN